MALELDYPTLRSKIKWFESKQGVSKITHPQRLRNDCEMQKLRTVGHLHNDHDGNVRDLKVISGAETILSRYPKMGHYLPCLLRLCFPSSKVGCQQVVYSSDLKNILTFLVREAVCEALYHDPIWQNFIIIGATRDNA